MRAFLPFLLRDTVIVTTATMLWGLAAWVREFATLGPIASGIGKYQSDAPGSGLICRIAMNDGLLLASMNSP